MVDELGHGRRKPYTQIGIRRLRCVRCKKYPAAFQWSICSDGNLQRPICLDCDVELQRVVLAWIGDPNMETKVRAYEDRVRN